MTAAPPSSWTTPAVVALELVELRRDDGHPIDALWYAADDARVGMLHVHGKGSSVLSGPSRFLPPHLPGIAHLAVNMRCHDLAYTVGTDDWAVDGGMWENLETGHLDLAAGVAHLRSRGVEHVVVCGHSSGGFYAADLARGMVAEGRGRELIPAPGWFHAISAASLVQRLQEPDGVWSSNVGHATAPVLMAWGDAEPRHPLWGELFAEFAGAGDRRLVLAGADHYYRGQERELTSGVADFLDEVFGTSRREAAGSFSA